MKPSMVEDCGPYNEDEVTFFMQTHNEGQYAFQTASRIRELYQNARIVVRSDGLTPFQFDWQSIDVEFYNEEVLFRLEHGGAAVQRMLEIFLSKEGYRFLVKVDPDTVFHRKLNCMPRAKGLFGTVQELEGCYSIQGGFIGFSRCSARQIVQSRLLLCSKLRDPNPNEGGYMKLLHRRGQRVSLPSYDWSLGWAAKVLKIDLLDFSEVHCTWKEPVSNPMHEFAITHPDARQPGHAAND